MTILIEKRRYIGIGIALLSLYLITSGGGFFTSDGNVMYFTTRAIVREGTIRIEERPELGQIVEGRDGYFYSKYDLGQPVAAIPFYLLGHVTALILGSNEEILTQFTVSLLPQVATAAAGVGLYGLLKRLGTEDRRAVVLTGLWATGTLAWPYSKFYFAEAMVTMCVVFAFWAASAEDRRGLLWASIWMALAFNTRATSGLYFIPLGIYALFRWKPRDIFIAMLPGVVLAIAAYGVHYAVRGGTGYGGETFVTPLHVGIYGLTLSPGKGLLWYSPLAALGVVGLPRFYQRERGLALAIGIIIIVVILFFAGWWAWYGGWAWGPRFLVPLMPLLMLPLTDDAFWPFVAPAYVLSLFATVPGVFFDFNQYIVMQLTGPGGDFILERERLQWFTVTYSPLVGHWRMFFKGVSPTVVMHNVSRFGLPLLLDVFVMPFLIIGLIGGSLLSVWGFRLPSLYTHRQRSLLSD